MGRSDVGNAVIMGGLMGGVLAWVEWSTARDIVLGVAALIAALTVIFKSPPARFLGRRLVLDPITDGVRAVVEKAIDPIDYRLAVLEEAAATIVHEVRANGGNSLKDKVNEIHSITERRSREEEPTGPGVGRLTEGFEVPPDTIIPQRRNRRQRPESAYDGPERRRPRAARPPQPPTV